MHPEPNNLRFSLHGLAVEISCDVPAFAAALSNLLEPFRVPQWPDGFSPITGVISSYREEEVLRHLSARAVNLPSMHRLLDLYQDAERFWAVDDRWGLAELNLLKGQWRTWLVPQAQTGTIESIESAVFWPMAQLLRAKGLHLLPATAVAHDRWAGLILSPTNLTAELIALLDRGYRVIGQRWAALREEDGRIAMLHLPGRSQLLRNPAPRHQADGEWLDLGAAGATQNHAFCDHVILVKAGRRPQAQTREVRSGEAIHALRRHWPIDELHPRQTSPRLPARLLETCRCVEMQLSDRADDIVVLLDALRTLPVVPCNTRSNEEGLSPVELEILTSGVSQRLAKAS